MTEQATPRVGRPEAIASYLLPVAKALKNRGIDSDTLLRQSGINLELSADPLARLPAGDMGRVFQLAVAATGDEHFGLYASRYMLPTHIHALGTAMLASNSLMDLCLRIERYGHFLAGTVSFFVQKEPSITRLGAHEHMPLRREAKDMFWSFVLRFMRHLAPGDFNPERVDLSTTASSKAEQAYRDFYRCPVGFGSSETVLHFSTEALEQPLATASEELATLSDQVVRDYLEKLAQDDICSRVRSLLVRNLPSGNYSKEAAARAMHTSPRTLQKRLEEEGTSWRRLVEETRFELARSYLNSGRYSLAEIAFMLGFNDTSSFSRAFRRWTGMPPGQFRQSI